MPLEMNTHRSNGSHSLTGELRQTNTHSVTALVLCLCLHFFFVIFTNSLMPNAIKRQNTEMNRQRASTVTECEQADKQTNKRTLPNALSPLLRG